LEVIFPQAAGEFDKLIFYGTRGYTWILLPKYSIHLIETIMEKTK
jgi:hypothetical protein